MTFTGALYPVPSWKKDDPDALVASGETPAENTREKRKVHF